MKLNPSEIYPTKIFSGLMPEEIFSLEEYGVLQDIVVNSSMETHDNLSTFPNLPAYTNNALFEKDVDILNKLKKQFENYCIELHEEKYPNLKDKIFVHDINCKGIIINKNTTIQETFSYYPWHYTGIFCVRAPKDLKGNDGGIFFIDPLPVSEKNDQYGLKAVKGNFAVIPSWLKFRFSPVSYQSDDNDTVIYFIMNAFLTHQKIKDYMSVVKSLSEEASSNYDERDLTMTLSPDQVKETETDIGWSNSGM